MFEFKIWKEPMLVLSFFSDVCKWMSVHLDRKYLQRKLLGPALSELEAETKMQKIPFANLNLKLIQGTVTQNQ